MFDERSSDLADQYGHARSPPHSEEEELRRVS
jgi:hypothetical protein